MNLPSVGRGRGKKERINCAVDPFLFGQNRFLMLAVEPNLVEGMTPVVVAAGVATLLVVLDPTLHAVATDLQGRSRHLHVVHLVEYSLSQRLKRSEHVFLSRCISHLGRVVVHYWVVDVLPVDGSIYVVSEVHHASQSRERRCPRPEYAG